MQEYSLLQYECVFGIVLIGDEVEVELSQERKLFWLNVNGKTYTSDPMGQKNDVKSPSLYEFRHKQSEIAERFQIEYMLE